MILFSGILSSGENLLWNGLPWNTLLYTLPSDDTIWDVFLWDTVLYVFGLVKRSVAVEDYAWMIRGYGALVEIQRCEFIIDQQKFGIYEAHFLSESLGCLRCGNHPTCCTWMPYRIGCGLPKVERGGGDDV